MWPFDVTQARPKAQQQFDICYENWRVWPIIHWSDDWCPFCTRDTNCSFPTAWQYHQQQLLPQRMNHGEPINLTDPHTATHNSTPLQHTLIFRTNLWYVFGILPSLSDFLIAFLLSVISGLHCTMSLDFATLWPFTQHSHDQYWHHE